MERSLLLCCCFIWSWDLFVQTNITSLNTFRKCCNSFVQSIVDARRPTHKNPNSIVAAEISKMLTNSYYAYQIEVRSRLIVPKHLNKKRTPCAKSSNYSKKLDHVSQQLHEAELAKADIQSKKLVIIVFFILQDAKLWLLKLYYNFFDKYCDIHNFQ